MPWRSRPGTRPRGWEPSRSARSSRVGAPVNDGHGPRRPSGVTAIVVEVNRPGSAPGRNRHETEIAMSLPAVTTRERWLIARRELLTREKELTRQRDALNTSRRELPMVRIDEDYIFEGPDGQVCLIDMFGPSRQLVVQHVMYDPSWEDACPSCSAGMDGLSAGLLAQVGGGRAGLGGVCGGGWGGVAGWGGGRGWG